MKKVIKKFNMKDDKLVGTPLGSHFRLSKDDSSVTEEESDHMDRFPYASAIGTLMYAMVCTRPDIAHAVGIVSQFISNPNKQHWEDVNWIFRYLKGSSNLALFFRKSDLGLEGFVDADNGTDIDTKKSISGYVHTFGGTTICWVSKLQIIVVLSSCEANYVVTKEATNEMICLQSFPQKRNQYHKGNVIYCNSQSDIHLAKNLVYHVRIKHIQLRYHFTRPVLEDKVVVLEKIGGSKNLADMLTKVLPNEKLKLCATSVGLQE